MARKTTHEPLDVYINNRLVGPLFRESSGAIGFRYDPTWLEWEHRFAMSQSLPLQEATWRGAPVIAVFENLLPNSPDIRRRVAERTGADGSTPTACSSRSGATA